MHEKGSRIDYQEAGRHTGPWKLRPIGRAEAVRRPLAEMTWLGERANRGASTDPGWDPGGEGDATAHCRSDCDFAAPLCARLPAKPIQVVRDRCERIGNGRPDVATSVAIEIDC